MFDLNRRALAVALTVALAGCATAPPPAVAEQLLLRLPPASLGRTLALRQQLTLMREERTQRMEVLLEADAQTVRLALMTMGQTAARLQWDGQHLEETRAPWWPDAVRGERILSDLQLVLWPAEAVRAALPAGWSLDASAQQRVLRRSDEAVATVHYASALNAELVNLREGWRLVIESQELG